MPSRRTIVASASEDRLEKLIEERLRPGADKKLIDERIWDLFGDDTAKAGEILITGAVERLVHNIGGITFNEIDDVPPGADKAYKVSYTL
jgi:hypothetical protein